MNIGLSDCGVYFMQDVFKLNKILFRYQGHIIVFFYQPNAVPKPHFLRQCFIIFYFDFFCLIYLVMLISTKSNVIWYNLRKYSINKKGYWKGREAIY